MEQIIGHDGRIMEGDEGQLAMIVSGIEDGTYDHHEGVSVGAPMAIRMASRPGASRSPVLQRFGQLAAQRPTQQLRPFPMPQQRPQPLPYHPAPQPVQLLSPPGPQVQNVGTGAMREVVQGLDSGAVAIAAGAQATITFNASMLFRPTRLMIGPTIAPLWTVDDLKIASDSLFLSTGAVPGEVFLPDSVGASALKRRTAQPGTPVTVLVTNIDGAAHRFRGAIFGDATDAANCG